MAANRKYGNAIAVMKAYKETRENGRGGNISSAMWLINSYRRSGSDLSAWPKINTICLAAS